MSVTSTNRVSRFRSLEPAAACMSSRAGETAPKTSSSLANLLAIQRLFEAVDHLIWRGRDNLEKRIHLLSCDQIDVEFGAFRVLAKLRIAQRRREGGAQRRGAVGR